MLTTHIEVQIQPRSKDFTFRDLPYLHDFFDFICVKLRADVETFPVIAKQSPIEKVSISIFEIVSCTS